MTLRVYVAEPDRETPRDARVARSSKELILLNDVLMRAQGASGRDEDLWLMDERLLAYVPRRAGGLIEVHRLRDVFSALEAAYGHLPAALSREVAERWLASPHPEGIPLLQLLLARVLQLPELARPGAAVPLTRAVEAVVRVDKELEEPLVREAWAIHGPPPAVGTATSPGPLRDPRVAPAVLVARLLADYPTAARTSVLEATNWRIPNTGGLAALMQMLELPDPRVLGPERLASLSALLRPVLEAVPLQDYLATVSGRLRVELEVLLERLECGDAGGGVVVGAISLRFNWLLQVDAEMAVRFERFADARTTAAELAPPVTGSETIEAAQDGLAQWTDYFTRRFLPALATWRRMGHPQDGALARALFAADAAFAKWIALAYPKLKGLPIAPLAYREIRRRSRPGPCIVLLLDGLAYELADILREEALAAGIWLSEVGPWLASLPTVTDVAMVTAVCGLPADVAWSDDSCQMEEARRRREDLLRQREPDAVVRALSQVDQVEDALKSPSSLYVLVWSEVDSAAHRCANPGLFADHARVSLRHVLRAIVRAVETYPHLRRQKDRLSVLMSADHGWTDLLETEPAPRLALHAATPHHRLYEVPRRMRPEEVTTLGAAWIAIGGPEYDLPDGRTYVVPADNRPIGRGCARQHGGLSQGEVFVPIAIGSFVRRAYRGLAMVAIAAQPLQKDSKGEVSLVVSNPNEGVLRNLRVTCLDLDLRVEIEQVPPQSSGTFGPFPVRPKASGAIEVVDVLLSYEGSAIGPQKLLLEAPVQVERTLEERMAGDYSRLDSLFGDRAG